MIALRALLAALAPFNSGQLFQFSMRLFYEPTHLVLVLNNLRVGRTRGTTRDHSFNVAVRGDHLEKLHFKGDFFELNRNLILELFAGLFDLLEVNAALLFTEADEAIFF